MGFYDDSGKPVSIPCGDLGALSTVSDILPAYGFKYFEVGDPQSKITITGSAVTHSDPSIGLQAVFRHHASGNTFYEAAIQSSAGATEAEIAFENTIFAPTGSPTSTGIAIANLDAVYSATVLCTARNRLGNVIPNAVSVPLLNPLGHWSGYNFPALAGLQGTLTCTSNTKIGMVALRALRNGAISSLPVVTR